MLERQGLETTSSNITLSVEREDIAASGDFRTRQLRGEVVYGYGRTMHLMPSYYLDLDRLGQRVALAIGMGNGERQKISAQLQDALAGTGGTGSIIDIDVPWIASLIWLYPRLGVVKLQREETYKTFKFPGGSQRYYYEVGETLGGSRYDQPGKLVRVVLETRPLTR